MDLHSALLAGIASGLKAVWPLLLLVPLLVLLRLFKPWIKGRIGEGIVNHVLERELPATAGYRLFRDVTLELSPGDTTQIDHVVVGPGGVTVIETKHFKGWIFGEARAAQWTQVIYRHKTRFQNPFRQNWKHMLALRTALDLPEAAVHSAVVLLGCEWKGDVQPEGLYLGARELVRAVRKQPPSILTLGDVTRIADALAVQRLAPGLATHRQHVVNVRTRRR